ncbi:PREDICTED: uncharacterized protein LOC104588727 isoform X2 [Nelumbo nucifera]|uniref:Uncharacterized protein LOC104588727 isoform X2 n=1 Tax=Nelumbo nucifera TaxID=4432 RepID=A0A1U7ZCN8_NELNU|nr:PREDICTED: uncharacterized protein LOC104588727 isoform X2 [Nelumbo nucifera]
MTGSRCSRRKMMGRGAEGGCGTEQKPCPVSRVSNNKFPAKRQQQQPAEIDFYAQARKALSERCPYESDDVPPSRVSTLPVGLADFLSKYSDGRKKHKKSHSEAVAKKASGHGAVSQPQVSNIWVEMEDYFRPVMLNDIDNLFALGTPLGYSAADLSRFSIPKVREAVEGNVDSSSTAGTDANAVEVEVKPAIGANELENARTVAEEAVVPEDTEMEEPVSEEVGDKEIKEEEQYMEIDSGGADILPQEEMTSSVMPSSFPLWPSLEWLLGSRNKILLTSERPSKKRKLLGGDAGLERLVVARPSEGQGSFVCHVCCLGETGEQSNQLLVCGSCNASVHQKCYGVQNVPDVSWLCSWCKQQADVKTGLLGKGTVGNGNGLFSRPCVLCPKQGGALKPLGKDGVESKSGGAVKFAHLFCCQWMPEVYVKDTKIMEPIMNVESIKDTRRKLVCNLCKVKYGVCIRCSHGTCRTSFHPICAREAKHRMEIWGKTGFENVELRAFCSKHSEFQEVSANQHSSSLLSVNVGCDSSAANELPVTLLEDKPHKLNLGPRNGDNNMVHVNRKDANLDKLDNVMTPLEQDAKHISECGDTQESIGVVPHERNNNGEINLPDSLDFVQILKKLIDRGKAFLSDVALEIGISSDSLAAVLAGDRSSFLPDLRCRITKWLGNHAYMSDSQKKLKSGRNSAISLKVGVAGPDGSNAVVVASPDVRDNVHVKSVPPRRRTKSNIKILKGSKVVCPSKETSMHKNENGAMIVNQHTLVLTEDPKNGSSNEPLSLDGYCCKDPGGIEKVLGSSVGQPTKSKVDSAEPAKSNILENGELGYYDTSIEDVPVTSSGERSSCVVDAAVPIMNGHISGEDASSCYTHPFISKRLIQMQTMFFKQKNSVPECDDSREKGMPSMDGDYTASVYCNYQDRLSTCSDMDISEQLVKARKMGILDLSPEDEIEGQLIYFQNRLIDNAIARKRHCDNLIFRVAKRLPQEIDDARKQKWDAVLVNQYLCELREAKKQGRKEKRHKEAQAVLAAATAAAAASSRISSLRKDGHDEAAHHESLSKLNTVSGRAGPYSPLLPRAKETLSKLAVGRVSSEKQSDSFQLSYDFPKEQSRSCDICRRPETILNPILVCSNCKVAVHLICYRNVKDQIGPWYCELCEDLLPSRSPTGPAVNSQEKPSFVVHCALCGATSGAFRKSTDGLWVHAFCAEWVLESTFRRGQQNPVEGMEAISKERDVCFICHRRVGVCIKCNYGHCQSTFHPYCARNAGLFMHVKTGTGKLQHKAYCEKHSLEQKEKAETQQHGVEELKAIKQIRVELERLRLLCERIVKREKLKRELVLCSHDILASKRDAVAFSVLVHSPFFQLDVSSESASTNLKCVDDHKSCSETIHKPENATFDGMTSGKRRVMVPVPMDFEQKIDDSSTSQHIGTRRPTERMAFSGKQLPHRPAPVASRNSTDEGERKSKSRKHTETFQKELVMTSDQASVQNQRLPKGFAYVPLDCLSKEKLVARDTASHEPLERDG